jgi:hypothetical protein
VEGPFIHIQWVVLTETRDAVTLPVGSTVAEEISLLQLWKKYIDSRCRVSVKNIRWGKHYRGSVEIEEGEVTSLQEGDSVEVIIVGKKKKDDRIEVPYTIGDEPQVYKIWVKGDALVGDVKKTIATAHKTKYISALASEGADMADEDSFDNWAKRTGGNPAKYKRRSPSYYR